MNPELDLLKIEKANIWKYSRLPSKIFWHNGLKSPFSPDFYTCVMDYDRKVFVP